LKKKQKQIPRSPRGDIVEGFFHQPAKE